MILNPIESVDLESLCSYIHMHLLIQSIFPLFGKLRIDNLFFPLSVVSKGTNISTKLPSSYGWMLYLFGYSPTAV